MIANTPKNILIVDDEPMLRDVLEFEISDMGFVPLCASNGSEAIEIVKTKHIDAVISDIRMPGGDGVALLDAIKDHNIEAPVVLLMTGFSDLSLEDAYDKGAAAVFSKPLDMDALRDFIAVALNSKGTKWMTKCDLVSIPGQVELIFEGIPTLHRGSMLSLGRGGMFVRLSDQKPPHDHVTFRITFAADTGLLPIEGSGIVRWSRTRDHGGLPQGIGIEFIALKDPGRQQVIAMIDGTNKRSYIPNS